jgi:hypothetical protein
MSTPSAHNQHSKAVSRKAKNAPSTKTDIRGAHTENAAGPTQNSSYTKIGLQNLITVKTQRRNRTRNRCFTIVSSFSVCVLPEQKEGAGAVPSLSWPENVVGSQPGRERTRPALNRNQLADRSPQNNLICK